MCSIPQSGGVGHTGRSLGSTHPHIGCATPQTAGWGKQIEFRRARVGAGSLVCALAPALVAAEA